MPPFFNRSAGMVVTGSRFAGRRCDAYGDRVRVGIHSQDDAGVPVAYAEVAQRLVEKERSPLPPSSSHRPQLAERRRCIRAGA